MRKKRSKLIIVLMFVCIILSLVYFIISRASLLTNQIIDNLYTGRSVTRGDIQKVAEGSGTIVSEDKQSVIFPFKTQVQDIFYKNGDSVQKGTVILSLKSDELEEKIQTTREEIADFDSTISDTPKNDRSKIGSIVYGKVKKVYVEAGDSLSAVMKDHGCLMVISTDKQLKSEFMTSDNLAIGDELTIISNEYSSNGIVVEAHDQTYSVVYPDAAEYVYDEYVDIIKGETKIAQGIVKCNSPHYVMSENGIVDSVSVKANDNVEKGTTLLNLKGSISSEKYGDLIKKRNRTYEKLMELYDYREMLDVKADIDGIVECDSYYEGDIIGAETSVMKVIDTKRLKAEIMIDELDIASIIPGMNVDIFVDALPMRTITGNVERIVQTGDTDGITKYKVVIGDIQDDGLRLGMSVTGKIIVEERKDVIIVPRELIYEEAGEYFVDILDDEDTIIQSKVEIGLVNNAYAEIIDGVFDGEILKIENEMSDTLEQFEIQ